MSEQHESRRMHGLAGRVRWSFENGTLPFLIAVAVSLAVLIFRRPDAFTMPWFYAEEGRLFLAEAHNVGWASLFSTANGYFHFFPRLVANVGLSLGVPIAGMPWLNLLCTLAFYFILWWYTWTRFPASPTGRFFAVSTITLVPLGNEIWMNQTNLQWPISLLLVLILFGPVPSGRFQRGVDAILLLVVCFTGPYVLIIAPLILWYAWHRWRTGAMGTARTIPNVCIALVSAIVCLLSLVRHGSVERTEGTFDPMDPGFLQATYFQLWYWLIGKGVHATPPWVGIVLLLIGIAAIAALWRSASANTFTRILLGIALLHFLSVLVAYRGSPGFLSPYYAGIRNFYLPTVLIAWALLSKLDGKSRGLALASGTLLLWWGVQTVLFVGPHRFRQQPAHMDLTPLSHGKSVEVPIDPPGWTMGLDPKR